MKSLVLAIALLLSGLLAGICNADGPPNIVIILADDLGIECVGAYGGLSYETPNLDRLARDGMRFSHCFANPYCSPSRAQLLTGKYPLHNGITRVIYDPARHREFLDPQQHTSFARLLQKSGYKTAIAGKWQLSFLHERDTVRDHGFDEYQCWQIFQDGEKTSRYAQPTLRQNGKLLAPQAAGEYGPDANVKFLIDFMKRHREQPFCVYYTSLLPHYPWEPTPDSGVPLKAADNEGDCHKYMPDMVAYLDKQVGQIVETLEKLQLADNTLILFTGDNGTDQRITSRYRDEQGVEHNVAGGKGTMTDAGTRVPLIARWPGKIEAGTVCGDLVDLSDFLPTVQEMAGADPPRQPINGRSFAPQLLGRPGQSRSWIHIQNQGDRYVRGRDYILTSGGQFRPVMDVGEKPASPLATLTTEQQRQKSALKAGMRAAGELSSKNGTP